MNELTNKYEHMNKRFFYFTTAFLVAVLFLNSPLFAQEKTQVKSVVEQARSLYAEGRFEQAQSALLTLLKQKDLPQNQQLQALILLAEIRRAMMDENGARKIIDKILDIQPDFTPSEKDYPPNFIALVQSEKQKRVVKSGQVQQKHGSFFSNKYFWIGIGTTAAATTAIILGAQKKSAKKKSLLALPPSWPEAIH